MKILKKISKVIVIVMAVLATIWCGLYVYANYFYNDKQIDVENFYIAELPLPPSQFEEDFKEIHQIVMENYSLYQAKHLNMDSLYQACDARVRQAQTTTDYGLIVQEYISALQCAHAITCYKRYTANQRVAFIEDSLFVDKPSDYLTEYGFQDKDRIIAINGLPYKQWIEQNEKYTEASTVPHRRLRTAYDAFRSYADTLRNYTLLRGGANGITDPEYSISCGVQEIKSCLERAGVKNPLDMENIKLALQSYNYGNGYLEWAKARGGYTLANAAEFSDMMAQRMGCER